MDVGVQSLNEPSRPTTGMKKVEYLDFDTTES